MEGRDGTPVPFPAQSLINLVEELRRAGYRIGPEQHILAQNLLLCLAAHNTLPDDPRQLVTMLGPVLCCTPQEQADFPHRYARWLGRSGAAETPPSAEAIRSAEEEVDELARRSRRVRIVVVLVVLAMVAAVLGWRAWSDENPARPDPAPPVVAPRGEAAPGAERPTFPQLPDVELEPQPKAATTTGDSVVLWLSFAIILVLWLSLGLWWRRRARGFLARRKSREPPLTHRLFVEGLGQELFDDNELPRAALSLRVHRRVEDTEIDIDATIEATVRAGGWLTPVMQLRVAAPEYLALVSSRGPHDHAARYAEALLDGLRGQDLYIDAYRYHGEPSRCSTSRSILGDVTVLELAGRHCNHDLWLFTDGRELFDPLRGEPTRAVDDLSRWPRRTLVTLERDVDDEERAEQLAEHGFSTMTASAAGLAQIECPAEVDRFAYPPSLRQRSRRWQEPTPPPGPVIELLLQELRAYLGEAGFEVLGGCAVYPSVRWEITLFIDRQLDPGSGDLRTRRDRIGRLARLPWFRTGHMPDWLRLSLIGQLPAEVLALIRDALRSLLLSSLDRPATGFELRLSEEHAATVQQLWYRVARHFRGDEHPGSPLRDRIFLSAMDDRLAFSVGKAVLGAIRGGTVQRPRRGSHTPMKPRPVGRAWIATLVYGVVLGFWIGSTAGRGARVSPFHRLSGFADSPMFLALLAGLVLVRVAYIVLSRSRPTVSNHLLHMAFEILWFSTCVGLGIALYRHEDVSELVAYPIASLTFLGGVLLALGTVVLSISSELYYRAPNAFDFLTTLERVTGACAPDDLRALDRVLTSGGSPMLPEAPARLGIARFLMAGLVGLILPLAQSRMLFVGIGSLMLLSVLSHLRARTTSPARQLLGEALAVVFGTFVSIALVPQFFRIWGSSFVQLSVLLLVTIPMLALATLLVVALLQRIGRRNPTTRALLRFAAEVADRVMPDRLLQRLSK